MIKTTKGKHLGYILVEQKVITPEELQDALLFQSGTSMRIGQILVKKGFATEMDILQALAGRYNLQFQEKIEFSDPENIFKPVPIYFLKKNKIAPYKIEKKKIFVAIVDPLNIQPLDDLKMIFPDYEFVPVLTFEDELLNLINTRYDINKGETTDDVIEGLEESDLEILSGDSSETEDITDMSNDAPIIRLVNTIIKQAVNDKASDIHFEPYEKDFIVRFRIDGILYQMFTPPKKFQPSIISRIKIMSNLNIAENRLPQDGRIQLKIGSKDIDIRVSVFPTSYGERIVLRLLNKSDMSFELGNLGFSKTVFASFNDIIKKTHGIVLVTGPTGSGKSTTLYSVLLQINSPDVNILTVEDPIEYQLKGIGQMQVKPKIELTFASGLRSILRQDPDIIMIGEIRDLETAEIAVQAALTGHRVFSTLHTNDAASAITRLVDMGIEPFLIASSVNAFLAQRLVRRICPHCKTGYKPAQKLLADLKIKSNQLKGGQLFRGKGCDKCFKTGYSGRYGIYEMLLVTPGIRKFIMTGADSEQIKDYAVKEEGMVTLLTDGIQKAIQGETTIEEVLRVC